ncbi:MAG: TolC family protein [Candidatus Omnitrophica bacterium]|nr:TolC family protein [Candidatus Omnitrophota bacterium]
MVRNVPHNLKIFVIAVILLSVTMPVRGGEVLTWEQCLQEAARNNPDLISAQEGIVQSNAAKTITASGIFPQISADLSASTANGDSSGVSKSFSYGLSASQLLFDGFSIFNRIHAANEDLTAVKQNFLFTSADIRYRIREAFVDLLEAQQLLILTQGIRDLRQKNVDLITLRYQSGTEHKGALMKAQANLAQAIFEIHQAERGIVAAQRQLAKELGRREADLVTVEGNWTLIDQQPGEPDLNRIAESHPSLLAARAQKNASGYEAKASQGDLLPAVILTGDVLRSGQRWAPKDDDSSAGLRVSLPIFEGGLRTARVAQAKSVYRQLTQDERSVHDGLLLNLQQAWNNYRDGVENVSVRRQFLDAAEERAKIARQQYSVGLIDFDNWTIIEDDWVDNQKSFLNVQAAALLAQANWIRAKGGTLEIEP